MKDGGRLAAAIEVLAEVETNRRPVQEALKDWGNSHRFAGSGDRTIIGNLVFDALRKKLSVAWRMGSGTPRALALGTYAVTWGLGREKLETVLSEDRHAPEALSAEEIAALDAETVADMPDHVAADVPEWLWPVFSAALGNEAVQEGAALSERAPIDMRVNSIKATREKVAKRLQHVGAVTTPISPFGMRVPPKDGPGRSPHIQAEEGYRKGWFELQDEASQVAALLAGAKSGMQVLDYCAGGGGKTLALAAEMDNHGQIYAYDSNRLRLAPIHERLARAGVRNVQVRDPATSNLTDMVSSMDLVFIDAPCTGTGVWRRRPDSKWRLSEAALESRCEEQVAVMDAACEYVKPGGHMAYVTCSVLGQENGAQVHAFIERHPDFEIVSGEALWKKTFPSVALPQHVSSDGFIVMTPASTATDGFFFALLERKAN